MTKIAKRMKGLSQTLRDCFTRDSLIGCNWMKMRPQVFADGPDLYPDVLWDIGLALTV